MYKGRKRDINLDMGISSRSTDQTCGMQDRESAMKGFEDCPDGSKAWDDQEQGEVSLSLLSRYIAGGATWSAHLVLA